MNDRQQRFVQEYCKDFNATQAGIRAGYSAKSAGVQAHELLKNPEIAGAIEERKAQLAALAEVDAAWVLRQWKQIATADPGEIMQLRRRGCRHCHGLGHAYHWTAGEYMTAVNKAIVNGEPAPPCNGGFGYDLNADPNPDCPECGGLGLEYLHVNDTRKLRGSAKRLYAGVQKTKDGLKIIVRDQDAALANISRYLGMLVDRKEISGPGGGPVPVAHITADDLSDDQLAAILKADENADET